MTKGADVLVYVNDGTNDVLVGGQKNATVSLSADTIETTAKGDSYKKYVAHTKSWTVSAEAFVVKSDSGLAALKDAFENGTEVTVLVTDDSSGTDANFTFKGKAVITSLEFSAPMDDELVVSIELQGTGAPTTFDIA